MLDSLTAWSLYRQLEGLEEVLKNTRQTIQEQFAAARANQDSFNHILTQITDGCAEVPEYVRSFSHIERANISGGINRSAYPRFLGQVRMLRQAMRAFLEVMLSTEEKQKVGFM